MVVLLTTLMVLLDTPSSCVEVIGPSFEPVIETIVIAIAIVVAVSVDPAKSAPIRTVLKFEIVELALHLLPLLHGGGLPGHFCL